MNPITHPLAIAHTEAYAAWAKAGRPEGGDLDRANDATHEAWEAAGFPLVAEVAPNTVKVRIAVATCADGTWEASSAFTGGQEHHAAGDGLNDAYRTSYVTAHVYLPEPVVEVAGEVEG